MPQLVAYVAFSIMANVCERKCNYCFVLQKHFRSDFVFNIDIIEIVPKCHLYEYHGLKGMRNTL